MQLHESLNSILLSNYNNIIANVGYECENTISTFWHAVHAYLCRTSFLDILTMDICRSMHACGKDRGLLCIPYNIYM